MTTQFVTDILHSNDHRFGSVHTDDNGIEWVCIASHGDYHGSILDKANIAYFDETYEDNDNFGRFMDGCYGYVTDSLWLKNELDSESDWEIISDLESLNDYPILDEDKHSEIEQELQQESFEYYDYDWTRTLTSYHPAYDWLDHKCEQLFWSLCYQHDNGDIFIEETGCNIHIDIDRLLENSGHDMRQALSDAMIIFQHAIFSATPVVCSDNDHPTVKMAAWVANEIIGESLEG